MNKKKVIKNAAYITIGTLIIGGSSLALETSIDHVHYYCPFSNILGTKHQVDVINNNDKYNDYTAKLCPEELKSSVNIIPAQEKTIIENGKEKKIYTVPKGYILIGDIGISQRLYIEPEYIEVYDKDGKIVNMFNKENPMNKMLNLF